MKSDKISIQDIMSIGDGGSISVTLPSFLATVTARNLVTYVRKAHPRKDGKTYKTSTDGETNTITISVVDDIKLGRPKKSSTQTDGDN